MYKPTAILYQPSLPQFLKITVLGSALAALGLTGCSSSPNATQKSKSKLVGSGYLDANSLDSLEDLLSATDMRAVEGDRLLILKHGDVWKRMTVGFKMDQTHWDSRIEAQRGWFISRQPYLDRLSARASRYLYHTVKEAERRGLPTELALLPIIESSYDPAATSSAAAAGMWQFIPSTGRIYGLKQTSLYDGRRDVVESTRAAYEFLGGLYNQFGSWELALAAYNAGPGRIQQAINRNKAAGLPTDYWSLKLPQETMNYVPRFLAVAQIIKNPNAYGVSLPPIANRPHFREVPVGTVNLNDVASITGLSRAELYQLNPGHRGDRIDSESPMRIIIPADLSPSIDTKLKKLQSSSGSLWASAAQPFTPERSNPPELNTQVINPVKTAPPILVTNTSKVSQPVATTTVKATNPVVATQNSNKRISTPQGSAALASFAANSDIPSAPRIPVAVTQVANVKPVTVEPPLSAREREQILAAVKAEGENKTVEQVLQPVASKAEQEKVVEEIKAIAPQGTEITDPFDGKIKLTAIQTSQSVAEQQGKELTKGFAYPKGVAENTKADSDEAKRNQGKNYVKTDSEIVVVPPKGKRSTYTVLPGDTLAVIAMKNGLNWRDVAKWNQIDPSSPLYVGTSIYLYDAKPQNTESSIPPKIKAAPETYVVQANDSLTGIASQFGLSVKQLADYNDLAVNSGVRVGQKLALKETASANSNKAENKASSASPVSKVKTKPYVVKRGEYLKLIADRYALSNQELADLTSGLTSGSHLMVGQKINVPLQDVDTKLDSKQEEKSSPVKVDAPVVEPSYKTESYQVQRGDTLYSIAAQSKISLTELAQLNKLSNSSGLQVGQTIKIPAGSTVPESYTVQSGDSLSAISAKYNLGMDYIANINGINRNTGLRVGQRLKLSGEEPVASKVEAKIEKASAEKQSTEKQSDTHVVKSGETLSSIAKKYHLQLDYLATLNGLSRTSTVRVGQRLKIEGDLPKPETKVEAAIPKAAKPSRNTEAYTVKPGESLNAIANRSGVTVAELAALNDLNARASLRVGQQIVVPKTVADYKIKRGDTLIGLANRYGVDTGKLAEMNDIQTNTQLRIGEVIKVPNL
ncbi:LysM peptidoglycan-binding domain-containing protein [Acinetobacter bohemicus]|uniref:LysM domain-containing protein n=1 Tax=Acinetobacter bohemicus TaxID=1435036 RepID=A0A1I6NXK4_9GAMM|nr:LysM peptidoglycan-binding domain-containing protein [Acinetobacter bohemicus]KAB0655123.1 LysM peptidoglycan-binding domain-containing protein [Acinetobacter bohemicus]SFS32702.1 LysM domain-containing protein [Acinetobacter bohemicus]